MDAAPKETKTSDNELYGEVRAYLTEKDYDNAILFAYRIQHEDLRFFALKQAYAIIGVEVAEF